MNNIAKSSLLFINFIFETCVLFFINDFYFSKDDSMAAVTTDGANVMDGTKVMEASGQSKVGGSRKKNRSRSASASSVDSVSSGSYTGNMS